jgi:hypothetical protein
MGYCNFVSKFKTLKNRQQLYTLAIIACLTLGLAPFFPEPHIVGKVRWVLGGAEGMKALDYFDLAMHGAPFLFLLYLGLHDLGRIIKRGAENTKASE